MNRPFLSLLLLVAATLSACSNGPASCPVFLEPRGDVAPQAEDLLEVAETPDLETTPDDLVVPTDTDPQELVAPPDMEVQEAPDLVWQELTDLEFQEVVDVGHDLTDLSDETWTDEVLEEVQEEVVEEIVPEIVPTVGEAAINEVGCHNDDFVELINLSTEDPVPLAGFAISDNPFDPAKIWAIPGDLVIPPAGRVVLYRQTPDEIGFTFGIGCGKDTVFLIDAEDNIVDQVSPPLFAMGNTWGRLPDITGDWQETATTPEAPNLPPDDLDLLLFDPFQVIEVNLTLSEFAIESLKLDPYIYVPGTVSVTIGETTYDPLEVGVRIKGQLGSKRPIDKKAAFKVKLNYSVKGQRLFGLKKLTLNNMVQDKAMLHEALAYSMFRAFGVACPRTGYAWVAVNGEDYGLYANIETPDDIFLSRFYQATTHLFEGDYGSDVVPGEADELEIDEGSTTDISDLMALIEAAQAPDDTWMESVAPFADLEQMVRTWVIEQYIGHWDGYAPTINNYYLHSDGDERFTMLPWGVDQTFSQKRDFYLGKGHLFARCMGIKACRDLYEKALVDFVPVLDALESVPFVESLSEFLLPFVEADPKREYSAATVATNVTSTINFLLDRREQVEELTACLSDPDADLDGDGYICQWDCNEEDDTIYFGALEVCGDGIDQSCSGMADDGYHCPDCIPVMRSTHRYLLCPIPRTYDEAVPHCAEEGAQLVSIFDEAENSFVLEQLAIFGLSKPWIGLNDLAKEGTWVWPDESPVSYTNWNNGEPNNSGNEDCTQILTNGLWNDIKCSTKWAIVCEDPCLPGEDADNDGFGPCNGDCDDADPDSYPGAVEICGDGIDQNCSGVADEKPDCTGNIPLAVVPPVAGFSYYYYPANLNWDNARLQCQAEGPGADLAWFDSEAEFQAVLEAFLAANGAKAFWVGLNDLAEEGTFTWADGSPLLYEYWNANEPNDWGNGEDCGQVLASGLWNDIPCGNGMWAVCKKPSN
jgi:hypothetical protein